jgi:hypothetical protein
MGLEVGIPVCFIVRAENVGKTSSVCQSFRVGVDALGMVRNNSYEEQGHERFL